MNLFVQRILDIFRFFKYFQQCCVQFLNFFTRILYYCVNGVVEVCYTKRQLNEDSEKHARKRERDIDQIGCRCLCMFSIYFRKLTWSTWQLSKWNVVATRQGKKRQTHTHSAAPRTKWDCKLWINCIYVHIYVPVRYFVTLDVLTKRFNCSSSKNQHFALKRWCGGCKGCSDGMGEWVNRFSR